MWGWRHHGRASWTEGGQIGIGHFRCIDDNKPLCENSLELPAAHVPEIRLYKMDGYETYYGQRTAWSIARFVQQSFRTKVTNLYGKLDIILKLALCCDCGVAVVWLGHGCGMAVV